MKTLLLMRHAKSSWNDTGGPDHDRPLNKRGKRAAPRMGELLREEGLIPDLILSSTARRARKTASKVAEACGGDIEVRLNDELYLADPRTIQRIVAGLSERFSRVLVVGHNMGIQEFLSALTGESVRMATGTLARIDPRIERWLELDLAVEEKLTER